MLEVIGIANLFIFKTVIKNVESFCTVERYTWILNPSELAGDLGLYYLLVRPIVDPGVKSVNASVTITSITAQCVFWKLQKSDWSDSNCRVSCYASSVERGILCTL